MVISGHECVYRPSDDTALLMESLHKHEPIIKRTVTRALDLGTGSGILARVLRIYIGVPVVVAVDVSPYALLHSRSSTPPEVLVAGCHSGECLEPGSFDLVVMNPPYLPPEEEWNDSCDGWLRRSWEAVDLYSLCKNAARLSRFMVMGVSSTLSPINLVDCLEKEGFKTQEDARLKLFFEELYVVVGWRP